MKNISVQEFDSIIEALSKNISCYEKCLETNKYFFGLANGENINLTFPRSKVAHLLGIKIEKLVATGIVRMDTPSYDIVQKLINSNISYYMLKNSNFSIDNLFSEFITDKLYIFIDLLKIRTDDLYCIIKYYPDRTYITGEDKHNSDYFIIRRHENNTYSALGIKKERENSNRYIPVTSRFFANKNQLDDFFSMLKNQEVTYPHTFAVENPDKAYSHKIYSKYEDKIKWCRTSKLLAEKNKLIPVNNSDTINVLDRLLNYTHEKETRESIIYSLIDSIRSGSLIDKEEIVETKETTIPDEIGSLIEAINDNLYSNNSNDVRGEYSYSELTNRIAELERKNSELEQVIIKKDDEISNVSEEVNRLNEQLNKTEECLNIYTEASAKVLQLRNTNVEQSITR